MYEYLVSLAVNIEEIVLSLISVFGKLVESELAVMLFFLLVFETSKVKNYKIKKRKITKSKNKKD